MRVLKPLVVVAALTALVSAVAAQQVNVSVQKLQPAISAGFAATAKSSADGVSFTFKKTGDERRLLAAAGVPAGNATGARAAEVGYELQLTSGAAPRLALIAYEKGGASWYRVASSPAATGSVSGARLSIASLLPTAFSSGGGKEVDWAQVDRLWVGFVFDGAAEGTARLSAVRLTDEVALPTTPVSLTGGEAGRWSSGQDPAVKATLAMAPEGPGGRQCLKYTFSVPGGRHMYAIPSTPATVQDLEGYTALRFKYRAVIPAGMKMLITLTESNGPGYCVEPPPPYSAEWKEMTLPLSGFKWASWTAKDDNGQFDLSKLTSISTGTHGAPAQAGDGYLMVCDLELVP